MKAYKLGLLAAAAMGFAGSAAQAADLGDSVPTDTYQAMGFYLRADAGWSFLDWSGGRSDDGFAAGGGVGYRFDEMFRADVRVDYAGQYRVAPGADMSITTALANLYFDIPTGMAITPYLGAGVGYGWGSVDSASDKDGLALGLMAGVGFDLTDNVTLDVGYRFREIMSSGNDPVEHQVLGGFRFEF